VAEDLPPLQARCSFAETLGGTSTGERKDQQRVGWARLAGSPYCTTEPHLEEGVMPKVHYTTAVLLAAAVAILVSRG
jgi:hypothetical protein